MKSKERSYRITYEVDKKTGLVTATIPELNHLSSFGSSFAEAEANVREAALGHFETLHKLKKPIPSPAFHTDGTYLKILTPDTLDAV
jgi:predicted RNase H-like HicB family nuclease